MAKKFYLTTPIYYVNDRLHIGHAYTTLMADAFARFHRVKTGKKSTHFLTGSDEHGAKIAEAAHAAGKDPKAFTDEYVATFKKTWSDLGISYDQFIRTTDPTHKNFVEDILAKVYKKGHIYKGLYRGKYCVGCERFVPDNEVVNNKCPLHPNRELVDQEEENYFFKLSAFKDELIELIESKKFLILPVERRNEVLGKLKQGLNDTSISRAEVSWGIPLPWDKSHTVYVWVDALFNYVSAPAIAKKKIWPAELHLVGKDILWFHSVIWPALLLAAGLKLPKAIFAHGFFTVEGQKMSKSLGNVISAEELIAEYGLDGARHLIYNAAPFGADGDISRARFKDLYNADLANGLGNLTSRVSKLAERLSKNPTPSTAKQKWYADVEKSFANYRPDLALAAIFTVLRQMDKDFNVVKPWEKEGKALEKALKPFIAELRRVAFNIAPFLPDTAAHIATQFSAKKIIKGDPLFLRKQ